MVLVVRVVWHWPAGPAACRLAETGQTAQTLEADMKCSAIAAIAAGSALATAAAVTGIAGAVADTTPLPAATWQPTAPPTDWGPMGPRDCMYNMHVSNEADYLTRMVAHHEEAVAAARQLQRSSRPQMRALGASIVTTQTAEIATMKAWLAKWYPGHPGARDYRPMMRDLSRLSGDGLDETFLQDMIPHHMAAIRMSQQLLASGRAEHPQVADFAAKVRDTQHAEMFQMRRYLADWFGEWGGPCGRWHMPGPHGPWH
ncbi:DUF305 domain-containing protein [Nonomuraea sp. NPDC050786]|uniref:DUF305 domain-containing protein n=1 Tax=Nonomuraea sp. NPDC050786 TaxID=3154840 RepID=UPI0033F0B7BF